MVRVFSVIHRTKLYNNGCLHNLQTMQMQECFVIYKYKKQIERDYRWPICRIITGAAAIATAVTASATAATGVVNIRKEKLHSNYYFKLSSALDNLIHIIYVE